MTGEQNQWGGLRDGAGAKSKWRSEGGTKLIRVPVAIEKEILEAARAIDAGQELKGLKPQQETGTESSDKFNQMKAELEQLQLERDQLWQERSQLDQEVNVLHAKNGDLNLLVAHLKDEMEQMRSQPVTVAANPVALTLLQKAITPKSKGGSYAANNATGLKRLVEQALELLSGTDLLQTNDAFSGKE